MAKNLKTALLALIINHDKTQIILFFSIKYGHANETCFWAFKKIIMYKCQHFVFMLFIFTTEGTRCCLFPTHCKVMLQCLHLSYLQYYSLPVIVYLPVFSGTSKEDVDRERQKKEESVLLSEEVEPVGPDIVS